MERRTLLLVMQVDLCVVQMGAVQLLFQLMEWMLELVRKVVVITILARTIIAMIGHLDGV